MATVVKTFACKCCEKDSTSLSESLSESLSDSLSLSQSLSESLSVSASLSLSESQSQSQSLSESMDEPSPLSESLSQSESSSSSSEPDAPCSCPENIREDKEYPDYNIPDYKIKDMSATYFGAVSGTGIYGEEFEYHDEISGCDYYDYTGNGIIEKGYVYHIPSDDSPCSWSSIFGKGECTWLKNPANGKFYTLYLPWFNEGILIELNTTLCRWELSVYSAQSEDGYDFDIWTGTKTTGLTPAGTYHRTSGNSSRATVDIEEF